MVRINRLIDVGQRLSFDALSAVHNKQRALNRAHRAGDLISKVDMPRRVDQIEHIILTILRSIFDPHGVRLDRNPALALDVHRIQHLLLHIPSSDCIRLLNKPVSKRGFPVVNMRHDREIAYVCKVCHGLGYDVESLPRQATLQSSKPPDDCKFEIAVPISPTPSKEVQATPFLFPKISKSAPNHTDLHRN